MCQGDPVVQQRVFSGMNAEEGPVGTRSSLSHYSNKTNRISDSIRATMHDQSTVRVIADQ